MGNIFFLEFESASNSFNKGSQTPVLVNFDDGLDVTEGWVLSGCQAEGERVKAVFGLCQFPVKLWTKNLLRI